MVAHISPAHQAAGEKALRQGLRFQVGGPGDHPDAPFGKQGESPLAHAAGEDEIHSQVPQPTGQDSRFVRRRGMEFFGVDYSLFYLDYGKLLTMAEVIA
jgi:hypothetical protein